MFKILVKSIIKFLKMLKQLWTGENNYNKNNYSMYVILLKK